MQKIKIVFYYFYYRYILRFKTRDMLIAYQKKKLAKIQKFASKESKHYRDLNRKLELKSFPIIDKSYMVKHFDEINTLGASKKLIFDKVIKGEKQRDFSPQIGDNVIGLSTGTSGNRGLYIVTPIEQAKHAAFLLSKQLDSLFYKNRVAYFQRNDSNLYSKGKSSRLEFKFFDLINPIKSYCDELNKYNPTLLAGPGSVLKRLALMQQSGELSILPQRIMASVEVLDPLDEQLIKESFKVKHVHQVYICTEGFLGTTCSEGVIHLNEELMYFEKEYINKEEGMFIPILTDLNRKGQPYIRYRLNDILIEKKEPCACGDPRQAIEEILGRCDDIFYIPSADNSELVEVYADFIRRPIAYASADIKDYYVVQKSPSLIIITLELEDESLKLKTQKSINESYDDIFKRLKVIKPTIEFIYQKTSNKNDHGLNKVRRVRRDFKE